MYVTYLLKTICHTVKFHATCILSAKIVCGCVRKRWSFVFHVITSLEENKMIGTAKEGMKQGFSCVQHGKNEYLISSSVKGFSDHHATRHG